MASQTKVWNPTMYTWSVLRMFTQSAYYTLFDYTILLSKYKETYRYRMKSSLLKNIIHVCSTFFVSHKFIFRKGMTLMYNLYFSNEVIRM